MEKKHYRLVEAAAVMLFTMQAVRVLLAMLFARVYDTLFDGEGAPILVIAGLLCVIMIILPLLSPRNPKRLNQTLRLSAILCAIARIPLSLDMPLLRLFSAIATLSFSGLYVVTLLNRQANTLVPALSLGLFIDQFLRALGHTYDLSLRPWWIIVQIPLSIGVIVLAAQGARKKGDSAAVEPAGFLAGIAYGSALFMLSSLYALPNAAARWTGGSYALMVAAMMAATAIPLLPPISSRFAEGAPFRALLRKALTFVIVLMGLTLADQGGQGVATISLIVGLIGFWLLLPHSLSIGSKGAGAGLVVGMVLFIILAIAHAFSFTYAYTISDFEGMGLPTFLAATVLVLGPGLLRSRGDVAARHLHRGRLWLIAATVCLVSATLYAFPWPPEPTASADTLSLGTYNIHYGFDSHWHLSLEDQARTIEASGADVIALQEVDTGRLTSYGIDDALWLSRRLGMEVIYLPTVEHTTGIAMLSRLAINESEGTLLPSDKEPTGILRATIDVGGLPLKAHAIWLGLSPRERAQQQSAALAFIGKGRATLAGDMNATPDSPVYETMLENGYVDPFAALGLEEAFTDPAETPHKRIDYVWVRGLEPLSGRVLDSLASDHRMVIVRVR